MRSAGSQAGFTLIELLVVIVIIAVLAGMLLPAVGLVRDAARSASCQSRQRQVGMMFARHLADNQSIYPGIGAGYPSLWYQTISEETSATGESLVFMCSEDPNPPTAIPWSGAPTNTAYRDGYISIGYNVQGLGGSGWVGFAGSGSPSPYAKPAPAAAVRKPAMTVLAGDVINPTASYAAKGYGYHQLAANAWPAAYPRHAGRRSCNILWADLHVSAIRSSTAGNSTSLYDVTMLGLHNRDNALDTMWDRK
ncbi:MAG: type II secretion system protein [Planctomycetes bacterium]|nr:type II secretion system protein [Planctomycetota bacterium]